MSRWCWPVVALLLAAAPSAGGDKPKAPSDKEIKALVDRLVSPNPPVIIKYDNFRFPKGFDKDKQKDVHEAVYTLRKLGLRAFPFLAERLDDSRYCVTMDDGPAPVNVSVGQVCRDLIRAQVQPYGFWPEGYGDPRGKPKRPTFTGTFLGSKKEALRWWEKNKGRTLYQIQLEALDWVIAEEAKRPRDFKDEEGEFLRKTRKELVKSGEPLEAGRLKEILTEPWK